MKFMSAIGIPCDLRILIRLTIKFCNVNVIGLAMLYDIDVLISRCHFHNYN